MAVVVAVLHYAVHIYAGEAESTAAIDVAVDLSVGHLHDDVSTYATSGVIGVHVVSATAEDVAVPTGFAVCTDERLLVLGVGTFFHKDAYVANHVAVGAATKDGAIDSRAVADDNRSTVHIGKIRKCPLRVFILASSTAINVCVQARTIQRSNLATADYHGGHATGLIAQIATTHRTQRTTTKHTIVNLGCVGNMDIGIALYMAEVLVVVMIFRSKIASTTSIHITA